MLFVVDCGEQDTPDKAAQVDCDLSSLAPCSGVVSSVPEFPYFNKDDGNSQRFM